MTRTSRCSPPSEGGCSSSELPSRQVLGCAGYVTSERRARIRAPSTPQTPHRGLKIALVTIGALAVVNLVLYLTDADAAHKPQTHRGLTAQQWFDRATDRTIERNRARQEVRSLTRHLAKMRKAIVHRPSSLEAIRLAAITYGVSYREMYNVAGCETGWTFDANAKNRSSSASGLFQFLFPSTWSRTPYARESVWSPYANALAAAWLWKHDGQSWREWVCKP